LDFGLGVAAVGGRALVVLRIEPAHCARLDPSGVDR
jgi:hypothetical protein